MRAVAYMFMQIAGAIVGSGELFFNFEFFDFGFFRPSRERGRAHLFLLPLSLSSQKTKPAFVWCIASVGPAANVLSKTGKAGHAGGFMVEFLLTFALMFVTLAATDASR